MHFIISLIFKIKRFEAENGSWKIIVTLPGTDLSRKTALATMCEIESPLSRSGLIDDTENTGVPLFCLPLEVRTIIFKLCPLWVLSDLVTVSKAFYEFISYTVSSVTHIELHTLGSPENAQQAFGVLVRHSSGLRSLVGVTVGRGPSLTLSGRIEKQVLFRCPPEVLFTLVKRNSQLENLVIYDFDVADEGYADTLFEALRSCPFLKVLYSEIPACGVAKIQGLVKQHKYLNEISFPNVPTLRTFLEQEGWSGCYPSSSGLCHKGSEVPFMVYRKTAPTDFKPLDSPAVGHRSRMLNVCKNPHMDILKQQQLVRGSSLRQSVGPARTYTPNFDNTSNITVHST